MSDKEAIFAA